MAKQKKAEAAPAPQDTPVDKKPEMTPEEREAAMKKAREANESRNNDRVSRLNAIADSNDELRRPDMEETDGTVTFRDDSEDREAAEVREQEESERALAEAQAKELQEEGAAPEEPAADEKVINGVRHYLAVVNGKEKWLTLKQLREISQKVESADEYLAAAAESVRSAAGQALSKPDEPVRLEKDELRKTLSAAVLGDEEAIEKLASALSARPSEVTPDVLQQIDQRLSFRTELAQLESEQREILEHPHLGRLFRSRLNELRSEAPTTPLAKAYRSIGKEIREAFPEKFRKSTAVTLADKEARKRTLVNPPTSAGRQQQGEETEEEESTADVIASMAKARGGTAVVHRGTTRN